LEKIRVKIQRTIEYNGPNKRDYFLADLLKKFNPKLGCEVGVRNGRTTFHLLDKFPNLTMYAIDYDTKLFMSDRAVLKYGTRLNPIQGNSHEVHTNIEDNSLDFVFIDASHDYNSVKKDIEYYTPKLKEDGWLCGHDMDFPGVNKAVLELLPNNHHIGPNNVWFTCLNKSIPIPFKVLDN
jgi:predicted O-methyltransferase YrrM